MISHSSIEGASPCGGGLGPEPGYDTHIAHTHSAHVAVAAAAEPQLHGERRHMLLVLEEHLLLLHSLLLQLACVSKHLISLMLMCLSLKIPRRC